VQKQTYGEVEYLARLV